MKKSLSILVLSILLLNILVSAQTNESNITLPKINPKDPTPKLDEGIEKEIRIPDGFKVLSRVVLGIDPNQGIKISVLITTSTLLILIFIVSLTGIRAIPSLGPLGSFGAAICLTLLVSATKILSTTADRWLANKDFFIFIDGWEFGNLLITIFALVILLVIVLMIKEKVKQDIVKDKEERAFDRIKAWFSSFGYSKKPIGGNPYN